jgi:hypothetical protein
VDWASAFSCPGDSAASETGLFPLMGSDKTVTSMKDEVGLCLQTGNMARMYADLIKLLTLYLDNAIKAAAIIVPSIRSPNC